MSDKEKVAPVQQEKKAAKKPTEKKTVIYLGPAIAGVVVPGTVYNNGLTPQMETAVEEIPALRSLLVDIENAGRVRKAIKDPQSAAAICYQKVFDYAKKKGEKG